MSASIWARAVAVAIATVLGGLGGCFNAEEEVEGLPCENDMQCAGALVCRPVQDPITLATQNECAESLDCPSTDTCDGSASATTTVSTSVDASSTASSAESACAGQGASCAAGEVCCAGSCANINGSLQCAQSCYSGYECASTCCCATVYDASGYQLNACVDTSLCGQEAECPTSGCASPGSLCGSDTDCCGGRCLLNAAGSANYCFSTCTVPTDCISGCCIYHGELGTSLCESC